MSEHGFRVLVYTLLVLFVLLFLGIRWYGKMRGLGIIMALMKQYRFREAKEWLDRYVVDFPNSKRAWVLMGGVELEFNNVAAAKEAYAKSLAVDPNYSNALAGMGVVYRREKEFDLAEDYYYKALKSNPKNYQVKTSLMLLELYKGNIEVAISLGEDSVK